MSNSDERELELLLQQLKENTDIDLRCHAAQQLGMKKSKASVVVPALMEALNDDNWLVRVEAATALGKLGGHAKSAIESLNYAMSEPRNRPKRGIFYEVIQTIKNAPAEEVEVIPSTVAEEPPVEVISEVKVEEEVAPIEETPVEPIVEPSEEVVEDVVEEPIIEEQIAVTEEVVEEAKEVDDVVIDEEVVEVAEEIIDEAFGDIEESEEIITSSEIVEEIADEVSEPEPTFEAEPEIADEPSVGEDITEIVEDVAEDISEDTTEEEIIEEAIEEIAEEVLEDVLEEAVGDDIDSEIIDDIAEDITEEVLEEDEDEDMEEDVETFQAPEVIEPEETYQPPEVIAPPTEEEEKPEEVTETVPLDDVLEFDEDKKKLDEQPQPLELPTVEDVKTVRMTKALLKIILVGDTAVGKTAIRKMYSEDSFSQEYRDIIGADFSTKHFTKNGEDFSLQIWDIAAKERFNTSKDLFFKGIFGALLIFDVTNRESFNSIRNWLADIQGVESKEIAIVLVGNKTDLRTDQITAAVTRAEGQSLAAKLSEETGFPISYVETSAETGAGIEVAFRMLEERSAELFFSMRDK